MNKFKLDTLTNVGFLVPWLFAADVMGGIIMLVAGIALAVSSGLFHHVETPWALEWDKWATITFVLATTVVVWSGIMGAYAYTALLLVPVYSVAGPMTEAEIQPTWNTHVGVWAGLGMVGVAIVSGWWVLAPLSCFLGFAGSALLLDHSQDSLSHALSHLWAALAAASALVVLTPTLFPYF